MNGTDQFYVFLVGICCGVAGGLMYDLICLIRTPVAKRPVVIVTDILFCILFAAFYLFVSVSLAFPDLRFYTFLACALGFFLYLETLHKIVAFFGKKIYNGLKRVRRGRYRCPEKERRVLPTKK